MPRLSLAATVTTVLKVVIIESMSASSLFMLVRSADFPPIIAWKVFNTSGPSRWRGRNHCSHDYLHQDMADRRMTNPVDPVIGHELPKKGTMQ